MVYRQVNFTACPHRNGRILRLLLIEDDRRIVTALSRHLKGQGYAVDVAADGEKGEELAHVSPYDVIILDVIYRKECQEKNISRYDWGSLSFIGIRSHSPATRT